MDMEFMVDPYATKIGGLTAVINSERFVVEDSESNSILSLHPGFTPVGRTQPVKFVRVAGFNAHEGRLEVEWEAEEGLAARTTVEGLDGEGGQWLSLRVVFTPEAESNIEISDLHPLYIPAQGPGALALGHRDLQTLALSDVDGAWHMIRLDGPDLQADRLGVFFARGGEPALVMGVERGRFAVEGARGKLLSLKICDCGDGVAEAASVCIGMGLSSAADGVGALAKQIGWGESEDFPPEFDASAEPETLPEPVVEEPEEEEVPEPVVEDIAVPEPEEAAVEMDEAAKESDAESGFLSGVLGPMTRRTAYYHRARRQTRSFRETGRPAYHGFASGRRLEPIDPMSLRTRRQWRFEMPDASVESD
jgi:hypothetical protein